MLCYLPRWLFDNLRRFNLCKYAERFGKFKVLYSKKNTSIGEPCYEYILQDKYSQQTVFVIMGDECFKVNDVISLYWAKE